MQNSIHLVLSIERVLTLIASALTSAGEWSGAISGHLCIKFGKQRGLAYITQSGIQLNEGSILDSEQDLVIVINAKTFEGFRIFVSDLDGGIPPMQLNVVLAICGADYIEVDCDETKLGINRAHEIGRGQAAMIFKTITGDTVSVSLTALSSQGIALAKNYKLCCHAVDPSMPIDITVPVVAVSNLLANLYETELGTRETIDFI